MLVTLEKLRLWLFDEVIKGNVHEKKNFDNIEREEEEEDEEHFEVNDIGIGRIELD